MGYDDEMLQQGNENITRNIIDMVSYLCALVTISLSNNRLIILLSFLVAKSNFSKGYIVSMIVNNLLFILYRTPLLHPGDTA